MLVGTALVLPGLTMAQAVVARLPLVEIQQTAHPGLAALVCRHQLQDHPLDAVVAVAGMANLGRALAALVVAALAEAPMVQTIPEVAVGPERPEQASATAALVSSSFAIQTPTQSQTQAVA